MCAPTTKRTRTQNHRALTHFLALLSGTSARHVSSKASTSTLHASTRASTSTGHASTRASTSKGHASTRANSNLRRTAANELEYRTKPWVYRPQKHGLCLVSTFKSQPSYGFGRSKRPCNEPREGAHVSQSSIRGGQIGLMRSHVRVLMGFGMI